MPTQSKTAEPQRILIVPLRYLGDTILTVPLIREIRHRYPQAQIDVLASKVAAPLLEPCPYTGRILIEPKGILKNLSLLRQGRYDAIFILRKSFTSSALAFLAGIPVRIGYDKQRFPAPLDYKRWGLFLTHYARYPSLRTDTPQALSHLGLLDVYSQQERLLDEGLELWSTPEDEHNVTHLLNRLGVDSNRPIAVLHAASASHGKQIALDKFVDGLQLLVTQGYQILATGTQTDIAGYEALKAEYNLPLVILAGKSSIRETFTLYKRIQLLLSVDSSPIHLAAAANVPRIVGVFGPTNERQWGPYFGEGKGNTGRFFPVFIDLPCRPCYPKVCSHNNCKVLLTAGQIALAVRQALL
jgi:heptosyltransferase-2